VPFQLCVSAKTMILREYVARIGFYFSLIGAGLCFIFHDMRPSIVNYERCLPLLIGICVFAISYVVSLVANTRVIGIYKIQKSMYVIPPLLFIVSGMLL